MTQLSDLLATGSGEASTPAVPDDSLPWPHRRPADPAAGSEFPALFAAPAASETEPTTPDPGPDAFAPAPAAGPPPMAEVPPTAPTRPIEELMAPAAVEEIPAPTDLDDVRALMVPRQYEELTRLDGPVATGPVAPGPVAPGPVAPGPVGDVAVADFALAGSPADSIPALEAHVGDGSAPAGPGGEPPADLHDTADAGFGVDTGFGDYAATDPFEGAETVAPVLVRWHWGDDDVVATGAGRSAARVPMRSRLRLGRR